MDVNIIIIMVKNVIFRPFDNDAFPWLACTTVMPMAVAVMYMMLTDVYVWWLPTHVLVTILYIPELSFALFYILPLFPLQSSTKVVHGLPHHGNMSLDFHI